MSTVGLCVFKGQLQSHVLSERLRWLDSLSVIQKMQSRLGERSFLVRMI